MKKELLITFLLMVMATINAVAQEQEVYVKDLMEANFYGGGGFPSGEIEGFDATVGANAGYSIGLDAGFFITNNTVGGFNFTFTSFQIDDQAKAEGLHHKVYS